MQPAFSLARRDENVRGGERVVVILPEGRGGRWGWPDLSDLTAAKRVRPTDRPTAPASTRKYPLIHNSLEKNMLSRFAPRHQHVLDVPPVRVRALARPSVRP